MWIIVVVLKERKVLTQSPEYEEIDKPGGKSTEVHYAVTPQALSVKNKNDSKAAQAAQAAPQYDYASTGTVSVSEKLSSQSPVITYCMYIHYMYVCIATYTWLQL